MLSHKIAHSRHTAAYEGRYDMRMLLERFRQPFTYALIVFVVLAVLLGWNSALMLLVFLAIGNDTAFYTAGRSATVDKKSAERDETMDRTAGSSGQ